MSTSQNLSMVQTFKFLALISVVIFFVLLLFPPNTLKSCKTCPTVTGVNPNSVLKFSGQGYVTNKYPILGRVYFNLQINFIPEILEGLLFFCSLTQGGYVSLYLKEATIYLKVKNDTLFLPTKLESRISYKVQAYTLDRKLYFILTTLNATPVVKVITFTDIFKFVTPFYIGGVPDTVQNIPNELLKPYKGTITSVTLNNILYRINDFLRYEM